MNFLGKNGNEIDLTTKDYVDSKDEENELAMKDYINSQKWVAKNIAFTSKGNSKTEVIGELDKLGINLSKMVVAPFVATYSAIPSTNEFVNEILIYGTSLVLHTTAPQKYGMNIRWFESK